MTSWLAIIFFVLTILVAILLHELGHLLTAKLFGMRADRYFAGFGPTLWSTRRGETEYGVKAIPLGGFVSIRGMTPIDERRPPIVDEVLHERALEEDRRRDGDDGVVTDATLRRFEAALIERGSPRQLTDRLVRRANAALRSTQPPATLAEARSGLTEILVSEVGDPERVGDLAWRVHLGDEERFFQDRPPWQRALAVFAGPVTHLGVAFALLLVGYLITPMPTGQATTQVGAVMEGSPADDAGLEAGDEVVAVQGVASDDFFELREVIRQRPGVVTTITIERDGTQREFELTPRAEEDPETGGEVGVAGYAPMPVTQRLSSSEAAEWALLGSEVQPVGGIAPMLGASARGMASVFSPAGLGDLVSTSVGAQDRDPEGVVSLIGIANIAGQTAQAGAAGMFSLLFLLAYVNTFLFLFNLVPLPPFDGGHLAVVAIEKSGNLVRRLRGRPETFRVNPKAITAVAIPVIGILLLVMVTTLWLDISSPLQFG